MPPRPPDAELIHSREDVQSALDRMAGDIEDRLGERAPLLMLVVMTGGVVPAVELALRIKTALLMDYVHATRYRGETRGREVRWLARPRIPLAGRHVLVVDDILDEGYTLAAILAHCRDQQPASVHTAVMVEKEHDRRCPGADVDFVGLKVPDRYVFGCGMDYHELWRNLPEIYALKEGQT